MRRLGFELRFLELMMKKVLAFLLAGIVTSAAADLKVRIVASAADDSSHQTANPTCPGIQCVIVSDAPDIHEEVMYVHGSSQRVEFQGIVIGQGPWPFSDVPWPAPLTTGSYQVIMPHMAVITHCDTGQVIELDLDSREYREFKQPKYPSEKKFEKQVERARRDAERRVRWNTVDTGETKELFGRTARHYITTIREKVFITEVEESVDGWYIDLPQPGCAPEYMRQGEAEMFTFDGPSYTDVITSCNCLQMGGDWSGYRAYPTMFWAEQHFIPVGFREVTLPDSTYQTGTALDGRTFETWNSSYTNLLYVGFTPRGLAVDQKIAGTSKRRGKSLAGKGALFEARITELSDAPVDPALFEVPPGFKQVKQLYTHSQILQKAASAPRP
jgi:hypothetical protein